MKTRKLLYIFIGTALIASGAISCQKDDEKSPQVIAIEDDAIADEMFDAVFTEVEEGTSIMENVIFGNLRKSEVFETCKTITVDIPGDTITWPKTITIDFGDGCIGPYGRVRKGKIIVVVSNIVTSPEYSRTITFNNFFIDDFKIEGTKTITKAGKTESGNPLFTISLVEGKITSPEGKVVTKEYNRTREWITGYDTPRFRWDDEYMVTGSSSGINRNGNSYSRLIVLPLHVKNNCPWVVSGSVIISGTGYPDATLDYGDDTCDRKATISIGDKIIVIILHR